MTTLNNEQFQNAIKESGTKLLDVRTPQEFSEGHLPEAINIDWNDKDFLKDVIKRIPKTDRIAVYCRSGKRSAAAAEVLTDKGYNVINLAYGILGWLGDGRQVIV